MAKYKETIDLYSDDGKVLKSNVTLDKISPLVNPASKKLIDLAKRSVAVNLGGIEAALKTGKLGKGGVIMGRELDLPIIANKDAIVAKIKDMVDVNGGETVVHEYKGGNLLLVEVPEARITSASTYDAAITAVAAATTYAIVDQFKVSMFDAPAVKATTFGAYPHTMDMEGAFVTSILSNPQNNEGLGYGFRNIGVNHFVMMTHRNAMQGAALAATLETAGEFEMGGAIGPFERHMLLQYAFQGLNANNLVYELVKENGQTGTVSFPSFGKNLKMCSDPVLGLDGLHVGDEGYVTFEVTNEGDSTYVGPIFLRIVERESSAQVLASKKIKIKPGQTFIITTVFSTERLHPYARYFVGFEYNVYPSTRYRPR